MKDVCILLLFLFLSKTAFAQLPPMCQIPNPPLAKTCATACILCDLDGYASTTTQTTPGQQIPGYCTQVVHSMGYIGFVAGSTNLTFDVTVGNCTTGNSIEMGLYQTDDCQTFNLVGDCNTAMFTGNTYSFTNTEPLHPGCPYFLVFDNNGPAACAFTVAVTSGSASAPPVALPEVPEGSTAVCPGSTVVYTIPPIDGACHYRWTAPPGATINGLPSPLHLDHDAGTSVTVTWGNQGGQLCVRGVNPCVTGPTACLPVTVAPIPPTVLPPVTICSGESYDWLDGNAYSTTQLLAFTYVTPEGCDSVVRQQLSVRAPIVTNLGVLRICEGDCVEVGNNQYCTPGSFFEVLPSAAGCDSTLSFFLIVVPVHAQIAPPDTITCLQTDVLLDGSGSIGDQFAWFNAAGTGFSTDTTALVGDTGLVTLIVTRIFSGITCRDTATVIVPGNVQPPQVSAFGDSITCVRPVVPIGGTSTIPGTTFAWAGPNGFFSTVADTIAVIPGTYVLTGTAPNGCARQDTLRIVSDIALPAVSIALPDTLTCARDSVFLQANVSPAGTSLAWSGPNSFSSDSDTVAVFVPGDYQVLALAPNGCADTFSVSVFSDTLAPQVHASGDTISCSQPSAGLSGMATPAGSTMTWAGPGGFSANQPDTATTQPGLYLLTATAPNGCTQTDSLLVMADTAAPQISVSGADTLTCAQDTVFVTANLAPAGSSVAWAGPQNFSFGDTAAALSVPGLYSLIATAPNGCSATATVGIPADTQTPQVSATGGTLTCLQTALTLSASILPATSTPAWSGPNNFSSTAMNPSVDIPGTYTITVTAPNGCTASATATVLADASIPSASAGGGIITCAQNSVLLSATVLPAGTQLQWTGPQGFVSNQPNPAVALAGTYTLTATTASGCTATATATVGIDTVTPLLSVTGGAITCSQPTIGLSANPTPANAAIAWSGPAGFSSNLNNPAVSAPGAYTAVASLPNGCTSQATANVAADTAAPTLALGGGVLTCTQPVLNLSATVAPAGSTVLWSGPQGFSSVQTNPSVAIPGAYSATVTAANGCTATANVLVSADTLPPPISATADTLRCSHPVGTVLANTSAGAALLWSGPQNFSSTSSAPLVTIPGNYTVVATGANGCTAQSTALVGIDTVAPQVSASGGLLTCMQPQLTLTATVQPADAGLSWTGPQDFSSTLLQPVVSVAGTYTLLATATNGCTGTATASVAADTGFPQVSVSGGTLTCSQTALTLMPVFSPPASSVAWTGPQNFSSNLPNPTVNLPGTYTITVTTGAGCTATSQAVVLLDTVPPTVTATGGTLTCTQQVVSLSANVAPAGSPVSWQGPNGFASTGLTPTTSIAGLYQITATAPNGCIASATATVAADTTAPQVSATGGTLSCLHPSISLTSTVAPASSMLLWSGPQQFSSNLPNPVVNLPGTYTLTATASNGCTATATATVVADTGLPQVTATGGTITCAQMQVLLSANVMPVGSALLWSGPQGFSSTQPNPTVSLPGTYTLTATLPNGCSNSATATVAADTVRPTVAATGGDLTCLVTTVFLQAVVVPANSQIAWSGPSNFSSTQPMPAVALEGNYTISVTAANGCTAMAQAVVTAHNQPAWTLSLGPDLMLEENGWVFLQPVTDLPTGQMAGVLWAYPSGALGSPCDTCLKTAFRIGETGTLSVQITDLFGCIQTASVLIRVRQGIYAPNVFAPESAAGNQLFALFPGPESQVSLIRSFRIFDRWGNLLHERTGVGVNPESHGWDGVARGLKCSPGVYVWFAEIEFENGSVQVLKGDVTLVR